MTDENKDIENNKEENHNIPEYNKSWWKFVGLWETIHFSQNQRFRKKQSNPTYRLKHYLSFYFTILILRFLFSYYTVGLKPNLQTRS